MRLRIEVDVEVDPALEDPHEIAQDALRDELYGTAGTKPIEFVSAEWIDR